MAEIVPFAVIFTAPVIAPAIVIPPAVLILSAPVLVTLALLIVKGLAASTNILSLDASLTKLNGSLSNTILGSSATSVTVLAPSTSAISASACLPEATDT